MTNSQSLSVVIPTYNRAQVLLNTLAQLRSQKVPAAAVIVVDQTAYSADDPIREQMQGMHDSNHVQWIRLDQPSIPKAMNTGLLVAVTDFVLFLDDDVEFGSDFIAQHLKAINTVQPVAQVGQIIQPWQQAVDLQNYQSGGGVYRDLIFPFNAKQPAQIENCMAGNLCVNRRLAVDAGGFDENFEGVAYRFETEFCRRLIRCTNRKFEFVPTASLNHLQVQTGGTRSKDHYLRSASPKHSSGDYYFALLEAVGAQKYVYILRRLVGSLAAKFYLTHPWYIPVRLTGELRGIIVASQRKRAGQKLISGHSLDNPHAS